jgi:O-antigen/teichoic acid export membrane protein
MRSCLPKLIRTKSVFANAILDQVSQIVLSVLASVMFARSFGIELYGAYQFVISAFVIVPTITGAVDLGILRFAPEWPTKERSAVFVAFLFAKCAVMLVLVAITATAHLTGSLSAINNAIRFLPLDCIVLIVLQTAFMPMITSTFLRLFQGIDRANLGARISIIQSATSTIFLGVATLFIGIFGIEIALRLFFYSVSIVSIVFTWIRFSFLWKTDPLMKSHFISALRHPTQSIRTTFANHDLLSYSLPLALNGLTSFVKDYLPVMIIGSQMNFALTGQFRIYEQIFRTIHRLVPYGLQSIQPRLIQSRNSDRGGFDIQLAKYSRTYLFFTLIGVSIMTWTSPLVVRLWGVSINWDFAIVVGIFAAENVILVSSSIESLVIMHGRNTFIPLIQNLARQLTAIVIMMTWSPKFGVIAIAVGLLCASFLGASIGSAYSFARRLRPQYEVKRVFLYSCLGMVICILEGYFLGLVVTSLD